ncbi:MAG: NAD(P)/FAD-dependent oxidoreductase [Deltaproteobacteria bacterium]|nr:NAD(P)/FAD-dependent oxidoreductase [Deltaproteobacteria bacterium]
MSAEHYDAIVIGGGPNGLICGAYLARAGKQVLLIERRHETGGGLNTDEYHGWRLNLHAAYHMMSETMPAYRDLDLPGLGVRYLYPHVVAAFPFRDGSSLVFTRDLQENLRSIEAFSPDDAGAFERMWNDFQPMLEQFLVPMTYELPKPALDQMVEFGETEVGQRLAEISEHTFIEMVDEYGFSDPRVRMALLSFPAMWGLHLDEPLGFLFPLYLCRMLGAGIVKGGSHRVSSAIYRSFVRSGGRVLDSCEVTRIVTEGDRAVAVEIDDGRRFEADAIVSTLNPEQTFVDLIDAAAIPKDLSDSVANWEWEGRSMFGLHLGVEGGVEGGVRFKAEDPRVAEAMIVFCGIETDEELIAHLEEVDAEDGIGRCDWLHFTNFSQFDATMAPPGHELLRFEAVVKYHPSWASEGKAFADDCLRLVGEYVELGQAAFRRHTTPVDIEQKLTTMKQGSIKHGAYSTLQLGYLRPNDLCSHSATPIPGLFIGGASLYPGGMILGGPGYVAAQVVSEELAAKTG